MVPCPPLPFPLCAAPLPWLCLLLVLPLPVALLPWPFLLLALSPPLPVPLRAAPLPWPSGSLVRCPWPSFLLLVTPLPWLCPVPAACPCLLWSLPVAPLPWPCLVLLCLLLVHLSSCLHLVLVSIRLLLVPDRLLLGSVRFHLVFFRRGLVVSLPWPCLLLARSPPFPVPLRAAPLPWLCLLLGSASCLAVAGSCRRPLPFLLGLALPAPVLPGPCLPALSGGLGPGRAAPSLLPWGGWPRCGGSAATTSARLCCLSTLSFGLVATVVVVVPRTTRLPAV